ncbi:hypothetical protein R0J91_11925, partial [Micrococcus sp. SIMBA_131]
MKDFLIGLRKNQLLGVAILSLWIKTVVVSLIGFNLQIESFLDLLLIVFNPVGSLMLLIGFSFYFFKRVKPFLL